MNAEPGSRAPCLGWPFGEVTRALYLFNREPTLGRSRRTALAHGYRIEEEGLQSRTKEMQELLLAEFRKSINVIADPTFSPVRGFVTARRTPPSTRNRIRAWSDPKHRAGSGGPGDLCVLSHEGLRPAGRTGLQI
jgi:hypothetical protein